MHGHGIDQGVLQRDLGEFLGVDAGHDLAPQAAGLHDIGLVDRGHLAAPLASGLEGGAGDALDLRHRIFAQVGGAVGGAGLLAEIDAAGQFAEDDQIDAFDDLLLQRRTVRHHWRDLQRPQIGEQAHGLADRQQAFLGPALAAVPFGTADGAQQDRVGGDAGGAGRLWQGLARLVDGGAADQMFGEVEAVAIEVADHRQDVARGARHLRSDAVAGQQDDIIGLGGGVGHQTVSLERS